MPDEDRCPITDKELCQPCSKITCANCIANHARTERCSRKFIRIGLSDAAIVEDLIRRIAAIYQADVVELHTSEWNEGSVGWKILLSDFDSPEIKLLAFLHELGHMKDRSLGRNLQNKYVEEMKAWVWAFSEAYSLGILFSQSAWLWAHHSLGTYLNSRDDFLPSFEGENVQELRKAAEAAEKEKGLPCSDGSNAKQ